MQHDKIMAAYFFVRSLMWNERIWQMTMEAQDRLTIMLQDLER